MIGIVITSILAMFIGIPQITIPPLIDGDIDSAWHYADSIATFTQWRPVEGETPTESTKVYICCDDKNIYIAFKCFDSEPQKLNVRIVERDWYVGDDGVWIMLDTFGDKATAYTFRVSAAGVQLDKRISDDGREADVTWDGVWYSSAKITDCGYNVEMKIPFKTLRFKLGITEWGINFFRYISRKNECVVWSSLKQSEEIAKISRCGILRGINPRKSGLHLEVYPVGLLRYETNSIHPKIGLDIGWKFTSSQFFLATYPDFAQIEADPYTINLSKYETYLSERRPFFIGGREVFYTPINLFYSRRIGKRLYTGKEVPIMCSAKYIGSYQKVNFGFLEAYTDGVSSEPKSLYSVGRIKFGILGNSDFGILYSEVKDEKNTQTVLGIDGTFRTKEIQIQGQIAKEKEYAKLLNFDWFAPKFCAFIRYKSYDENFNIDRIGYAPWKGLTKYHFDVGPRWFNVGPFYIIKTAVGFGKEKEIGEPGEGYIMRSWIFFYFKNKWILAPNFYKGKNYELDRWYEYYETTLRLETDKSKTIALANYIWYISNGFNYKRGYFASMGTNSFCLNWKVNPSLILAFVLSNTFEWKPDRELEEVSWVLRPTIQYALTKDIHLKIYAEPNADTHIHQFNALLSYNFGPKSWFYFAINETRDNTKGKIVPKERIAVVKIRYLFLL